MRTAHIARRNARLRQRRGRGVGIVGMFIAALHRRRRYLPGGHRSGGGAQLCAAVPLAGSRPGSPARRACRRDIIAFISPQSADPSACPCFRTYSEGLSPQRRPAHHSINQGGKLSRRKVVSKNLEACDPSLKVITWTKSVSWSLSVDLARRTMTDVRDVGSNAKLRPGRGEVLLNLPVQIRTTPKPSWPCRVPAEGRVLRSPHRRSPPPPHPATTELSTSITVTGPLATSSVKDSQRQRAGRSRTRLRRRNSGWPSAPRLATRAAAL